MKGTTMPAYVIANVDVHDPARYDEYRRGVPDSIAAHGGRYLARGGECQVMEGAWQPRRLVIVEFPTAAAARGWWESPEYASLKALRQATTNTELVILEGL
jgi:uncharacterized protein (DUF1330 family)